MTNDPRHVRSVFLINYPLLVLEARDDETIVTLIHI